MDEAVIFDLSLGEFESLVAKALRGAGYPWGLATDGAAAARRLAASHYPAAEIMVSLLDEVDGYSTAELMPRPRDRWRSTSGVLCPICVGAALVDHDADEELIDQILNRDELLEPLLAAAMVAPISPIGQPSTRLGANRTTIERLSVYAHRTYAPSSDTSRRNGAGAGLHDND